MTETKNLGGGKYQVVGGEFDGLIFEDASGDPGPPCCPSCGRSGAGLCAFCAPREAPER